ncbi:hypothetical protein EB75_08350 [Mycobacterium sp. ST-F2]|nr:hypothetical protein EB75_08350 [Mycobacterium sp. ST-F2]
MLAVALVATIVTIVTVRHGNTSNDPEVTVLRPVDAQGNVQSGWQVNTQSRDNSPIDCSFGSPSPYDVGSSVRFCGGTADSADACWPAADSSHVLCVRDAFRKVVDRVPAAGLSSPRHAPERPYSPFGLILDNGLHCQARIGGAWSSPVEHPDWVGYYWCDSEGLADPLAIWAPRSDAPGGTPAGITKNKDGWSVTVGPANGHLTSQRVAQVYYVGLAGDSDEFSKSQDSGSGGTKLVTKCGRTPEFKPESIRTDSGALVIRMKIVAHCPGGDVLSSPTTRVTVTSGGANIAAGTFDLSATPIVVAPNGSGSSDDPEVTHDFRFPVGSFWRIPVSTSAAPTGGATQQGAVDLDVTTLVVACDQDGSGKSSAQASDGSSSSTATGPAAPASGDDESASFDALRALANSDKPFVTSQLADRWVPQLSSKRPGLVAEGMTWNNAATLREHLKLRLDYPEVRLLWSGDWSTFSAPNFWITIAGVTFGDADGALSWCRSHNLDRDHCYAKLVSTTHPVEGSTAFNP